MDEVAEAIEKYHGLVPLVYDIETMGLAEARPQDMYYAVYLKREADKVIADKDAKILALDAEVFKQKHHAELFLDERNYAEARLRHHKYHRCLDMAARCESEEKRLDAIAPLFDNDKECWEYSSDYWKKWHKQWLQLAEQVKAQAEAK